MTKRNIYLFSGFLIGSAILLTILKGLSNEVIDQYLSGFYPGALFVAGFGFLFVSLFNKRNKIE
ncbi:hypothetical protein ACXR6G_05670 [Ancylomarina sp. YFZ004]